MTESPNEKETNGDIEYLDERIRHVVECRAVAEARFHEYDKGIRTDQPTSVKSYYAFQSIVFENLEVVFEGLKAIIKELSKIAEETNKTSTLRQQLVAIQGEIEKNKPMWDALQEEADRTREYLKNHK